MLAHIKASHAGSKGEYGWPSIWKDLVTKGVRVGKGRIQKLMKLHGIKARGKRKYVVTTDSKHNLPIAANLLDRNFQLEQPNAVWTGDITYEFQAVLTGYGMRSSMSHKGNCWDNAPTESLWGLLKVGRLYGCKFKTRRQAMDEVIDWLVFYKHRRLHSTLGYISPMQFENNWLAAQLKKAA